MKKSIKVTALLLLALTAGCGKDGSKSDSAGGASTQGGAQVTLTRVSDITGAENRRDLVGKRVVFENVRATSVVGDVTFWVGENNNTALIVKGSELRGDNNESRIRGGQTYRISGTVRLVDNVPRNDATWRLVDDREFEAIRDAQVYIESDSITPTGSRVALP